MFLGLYPSARLTVSQVQGKVVFSLGGIWEGTACLGVDEHFSHFQVSGVPSVKERSLSIVRGIVRVSLHSHRITGQRREKSHSEHSWLT